MSNGTRNPFIVLGVEESADTDGIKRAYRRLAKDLHPDRNADNPNANALFAEVQQAFELINTPEKRESFLHRAGDTEEQNSAYSSFYESSADGYGKLKPQGDDLHASVHISFREAFDGTQRLIEQQVKGLCNSCAGSGAAPGIIPYQCPHCGGAGIHRVGGSARSCEPCKGTGTIIEELCPVCDDGLVTTTQRYNVVIPAGIENGAQLRVRGGGAPGYREAGSLLVDVAVEESPIFERVDAGDLFVDLPVSPSDAALGATLPVPTPQGQRIGVRVPAGVSSGKLLHIGGQGMPIHGRDGARGGLYVRVMIEVPDTLTRHQKRLFTQLREYDDQHLRDRLFPELDPAPVAPASDAAPISDAEDSDA